MEPARGEGCPSGRRRSPAVPPNTRIHSHLRMRKPSTFLQLEQTGDENACPPGRYRLVRCGNPNPKGWLQIGWGSWSQRETRIASRDNVEVPQHPGRMGPHPRIRDPPIPLQHHQLGDENRDSSVRYRSAGRGNPNPHFRLLTAEDHGATARR